MSNQQPMWTRPSGPKPRVYPYCGFWAADVKRTGTDYEVRLFKSRTDAFNQAIEYAKDQQ